MVVNWFCGACEAEPSATSPTRALVYILMEDWWLVDNPHATIPVNTAIVAYRTKDEAVAALQALPFGYSVVIADVTDEGKVALSTATKMVVYATKTPIKVEVVQT